LTYANWISYKMKKLLILLLLFVGGIQPLFAKTIDTIDHWVVYLNNKKLHNYNMYDKHEIILKTNELKLSDSITVRYGSDTPCTECFIYLEVESDQHSILSVKAQGEFAPLSFSLKDLIETKEKSGKPYFDVFYYEEEIRRSEKELIFRIKLE
jgi:hypothetical protein